MLRETTLFKLFFTNMTLVCSYGDISFGMILSFMLIGLFFFHLLLVILIFERVLDPRQFLFTLVIRTFVTKMKLQFCS